MKRKKKREHILTVKKETISIRIRVIRHDENISV